MPDIVNLIHGDLSLDLRERIPVTVVIVSSILVIEHRWVSPFVRRAECLVVPVLDDVHAIRIQRGHKKNDAIL